MALFDKIDWTNPLPSFETALPSVDFGSFLPDFSQAKDTFGSIFDRGGDLSGFGNNRGTFTSGGFSQANPSYGNFSFGSQNQYNAGFTNYKFPWSKPTVSWNNSGSGGLGSAAGYEVLDQYNSYFAEAGAAVGIDPSWIKAIAMRERGWEGTSVSGAMGIMQVMPNGYYELQKKYPNWKTDPRQNIMLGAEILKDKINSNGGDLFMGIQRYLGVGQDAYGTTTEDYLADVKRFQQQIANGSGGSYGPYQGQSTKFDSFFGGVGYSISSENGVLNGAPQSWYYLIDDELGNPIGTHPGVDVAMPNGTPIYLPKGITGTVERASGEAGYGYDPTGGVARSGPGTGELRIRLSNGHLLILGHMQRIYFPVGAVLSGGELIGLSGTAGTGAHVHFEYRVPNGSNGWKVMDPRQGFATYWGN